MTTKFFTNRDGNTLFQKLEGVFSEQNNYYFFDVLVGYFRSSGYFKVRPLLEKIPKIRILVGIDVDKLTKKYQEKAILYFENSADTKDSFVSEIVKDIQNAEYNQETENGIIQFIQDIIDEKLELRAHPKQKIHAKIYIFRPQNFNEHSSGFVITGSSNFTDPGLGLKVDSNYEFNVSLRDYDDVKFASDEFESLWNESVPILKAEAEKIRNYSYIRDNFTPFEIYIKTLIEYFGKRVDYDPYNIDLLLPPKYMRLKYQSDAANHGYSIMMKHHGFILADVVGLGKTIIACMVIKKYIYENGAHTRILVVLPPALESAWKNTVKEFELEKYFYFISLGSLHKILNKDNYDYPDPEDIDLIVVDESHKFRNDFTEMYVQLQEICKKRRRKPSENGDNRKKVILISATPLNNKPEDIENQIYLFQDKRASTLENVRNLQDYFKSINEQYKKLVANTDLDLNRLKLLFQKLRNDIVEPLVIRRTRKDIENENDYLEDLKRQGIKFPKLADPKPIYYELDAKLAKLFEYTVSMISNLEVSNESDSLGYYRYRAIEFLKKEEHRKIYGNVASISNRLSSIMKTLLVKRLESSFFAFKQSLKRFQKAINNMMDMFDMDRIFIAPDLDINKLLEEGYSYEEIEEKLLAKGGNNKEFSKSDFLPNFYDLLEEDKRKVDQLINEWEHFKFDPKLTEFLKELENTFFQKKNNPSRKLVIFTESKETANELKEKIRENYSYQILSVSSENRYSSEKTIRENFDANLDEEKWKDEFQILITTEVLAEGINLHRSNNIINYDVPWNSTRLMQRIGRVNRIGSRADEIFVYNFYPSSHGDEQIRLVNHALRRLQAFHTAFGEDNRIFSLLEETGEAGLFGSKIQQEESESLKYLNFLRKFKKENPSRYKEIVRIPEKSRCGRSHNNKRINIFKVEEEIPLILKDTSIIYLKSDNHPGIFCLITKELNVIELSFLKAMEILGAEPGELSDKLLELHYSQIKKGLDFFITEKSQVGNGFVTRRNLSSIENTAIRNLSEIIKFANTDEDRKALVNAKDSIKNGVFTAKGFPMKVNNFFKKNLNLIVSDSGRAVLLEQFFLEIMNSTDFTTPISLEESEDLVTQGLLNPKIVLSQSFY